VTVKVAGLQVRGRVLIQIHRPGSSTAIASRQVQLPPTRAAQAVVTTMFTLPSGTYVVVASYVLQKCVACIPAPDDHQFTVG
jgi:hypothetical protein